MVVFEIHFIRLRERLRLYSVLFVSLYMWVIYRNLFHVCVEIEFRWTLAKVHHLWSEWHEACFMAYICYFFLFLCRFLWIVAWYLIRNLYLNAALINRFLWILILCFWLFNKYLLPNYNKVFLNIFQSEAKGFLLGTILL